jgi:CubicO group peptidase (beta-lactamase class C family)
VPKGDPRTVIARFAALVVPLASLCCFSQEVSGQQSTATGSRIGSDDRRIDSLFRFVRPGAPGCAVGIYRRGELSWARGFGLASVEHGVPITSQTVFEIGSNSKQFTAALVLMLVGENRIALDDPIRKYLPELPAWGDTVTIRQLLHHTSGVRDYLRLLWISGVRRPDLIRQSEALEMIARQRRLQFKPGTQHNYSNSNYLLLAEVVARRSGKSFARVARERLFEPLGMQQSLFIDAHDRVVPRRASAYAPSGTGFVTSVSNHEEFGGRAVNTSLDDLAHWIRNFEEPKVGGSALIRELEATTTIGVTPHPYARGLIVDSTRGLRRVRHGGSWLGFQSEITRVPDKRLAVATLCNRSDANAAKLSDQVVSLLLDDMGVTVAGRELATSVGASPNPALSDIIPAIANARVYEGHYVARGHIASVRAKGDTVEISDDRQWYRLQQKGANDFVILGLPVLVPTRFFGSVNGGFDSLEVRAPTETVRYARVDTLRPLPTSLRRSIVGTWYSEELDARWRIVADSAGVVRVSTPRGEAIRLVLLSQQLLVADDTYLTLTRNGAGTVAGFSIEVDGAKGVRFVRR